MPNQGMTEASIRPGLGEWEHMQVHDSGHTARLAALYESHATDVFHLTGRREDAEEVVQFVFLQAFATLETGHPAAASAEVADQGGKAPFAEHAP
jgi:hypothetical protein